MVKCHRWFYHFEIQDLGRIMNKRTYTNKLNILKYVEMCGLEK